MDYTQFEISLDEGHAFCLENPGKNVLVVTGLHRDLVNSGINRYEREVLFASGKLGVRKNGNNYYFDNGSVLVFSVLDFRLSVYSWEFDRLVYLKYSEFSSEEITFLRSRLKREVIERAA